MRPSNPPTYRIGAQYSRHAFRLYPQKQLRFALAPASTDKRPDLAEQITVLRCRVQRNRTNQLPLLMRIDRAIGG